MDDNLIPLHELLPEKVDVDQKVISTYTREEQFVSLAVELLKEAAIWTSLVACSFYLDQNNNPRRWTRDEAVLMGLMVRLAKLQSGFLDQVCQDRGEIADIIFRPLVETTINLTYLLSQDRPDAITEYIEYSLRTEKRLLMDIEENIKRRGYELQIETRMKGSIKRTFEESGISVEDVNEQDKRTWGKSIRNRAKIVGMDQAYLHIMGLPSHAIHGNWQDLITHHLEYEDGEFYPKTDWTPYRPQGLFAVSLLSVRTSLLYLKKVLPYSHETKEVESSLSDLLVRIQVADELHEQYLQKK